MIKLHLSPQVPHVNVSHFSVNVLLAVRFFSEEKTASNHTKHKDIMVDRKGQRSRMAGGFARTEWAKSYGRIEMRWF